MKTKKTSQQCFACGGSLEQEKTTFTADFGSGVVVIRDVSAVVCSQCGMEWIDDSKAVEIEKIVKEAKEKHSVVEVMSLSVSS